MNTVWILDTRPLYRYLIAELNFLVNTRILNIQLVLLTSLFCNLSQLNVTITGDKENNDSDILETQCLGYCKIEIFYNYDK